MRRDWKMDSMNCLTEGYQLGDQVQLSGLGSIYAAEFTSYFYNRLFIFPEEILFFFLKYLSICGCAGVLQPLGFLCCELQCMGFSFR